MSAQTTSFGLVYPSECDHMGHLNVAHYVAKFDTATWNFLFTIGCTPSKLRGPNLGLAAVEQRIQYKRELMVGDVVEVRSRLLELSGKKLRFQHEMINRETGEVAAICEVLAVCLDRKARKSMMFPAEIAAQARSVYPESRVE